MERNTNLEILLKDKIKELGNFLIEICTDQSKKNDIKETLIELPMFKILLFISFLDLNKIDHQITDFISLFKLNDTEENRIKIFNYIQFFISVKEILDGN